MTNITTMTNVDPDPDPHRIKIISHLNFHAKPEKPQKTQEMGKCEI